MTHKLIQLPSVSGIAASSAAGTVGTFNLPTGFRYHKLSLVYIDGGGSPSDVTAVVGDITVFKNTKAQRIHSAAELDRLNQLNGSQYARQQIGAAALMRQTLPIFFAEPWRKDVTDTDAQAWNVTAEHGWQTFQVMVKLAAAMPATGSLALLAWVDEPLPYTGKPQFIKKVYRQEITCSGLKVDFTGLDATDAYQTIALKHPTTSYIVRAALKRNSEVIHDSVERADNVAHLAVQSLNPANSITPGTFGYEIVLDADDPIRNALVAEGQKLWLQLEFAAAAGGNAIALIERVGPAD
jgi:hypothetical protein